MALNNTTQKHIDTNIHPNWRNLSLGHIKMVRCMLREGRYTVDCRRIIKEAQRDMLWKRRKLSAWTP